MREKDQKFVEAWAIKKENGALKYFLQIITITCLCSVVVIFFYTWDNIPENKLLESIIPLSVLIFGLGIPLGLILGWVNWNKNNNRYAFLKNDYDFPTTSDKKKWFGNDRIWDIAIGNLGAIFFILLYTSIFLFDSGRPTILKYSIVGIIVSYFAAQLSYAFYRYRVDKFGNTKIFPMAFKIVFLLIIFLTILFWLILFFVEN